MEQTDLIVIGGGIHGVGVAMNAASRGLSVTLFEKGDLGSGTSNASTKLIHGGLRYLESLQYPLVYECLAQQSLLLEHAAHLVQPLEFIIPIEPSLRPNWLIRLGLLSYDAMRSSNLPWSAVLSPEECSALQLATSPVHAFRYWDCQTDDHRLCIMEAMLARNLGAQIERNSEVIEVYSSPMGWVVSVLTDRGPRKVCARSLAVLGGPWTSSLFEKLRIPCEIPETTLIQGSHLIVPQCYHGAHAIALQNTDGRLVFFVPFQQKWTLIGSTDYPVSHPPSHIEAHVSDFEREYLLQAARNAFGISLSIDDIIHEYAGVRCLVSDHNPGSQTSRESQILLNRCPTHGHPVVSLLGGKLTSWRATSEKIVSSLQHDFYHLSPKSYHELYLPGNQPGWSRARIEQALFRQYPALDKTLLRRYARTYGLMTHILLGSCVNMDDLGIEFIPGLFSKEIDYLIEHEWAQSFSEIIDKRTRLSLGLSLQTRQEGERLFQEIYGQSSSASFKTAHHVVAHSAALSSR